MNIAIVGTGYVGLVTGACLADFGHDVICVDIDRDRIGQLEGGAIPFFEPELLEVVGRNRKRRRLKFTTDFEVAVRESLVIFLAVGTPEGTDGAPDLTCLTEAARSVARHITGYKVVVTKSTVPIGTAARIKSVIACNTPQGASFDVVSNPEFLREGSAVGDFMRPDRVVIGADTPAAAALVKEIYRPLYLIETPIIVTDAPTAEMIKYAANSFLAVKISFINEVANLCDEVAADVHVVAKALGLDKRIGPKFLHPGPGYGGSCFPKDTKAFIATAHGAGVRLRVVEAAVEANQAQRLRIVTKLERALNGDLAGQVVGVLGLSFKPNTSDVRDSPAIAVCRDLVTKGAHLRAYDPAAMGEARREMSQSDRVYFATDIMDAAKDATALVILTEWNEFRAVDLRMLRAIMRGNVIVDARNVLEPEAAAAAGFSYSAVGRRAAAASTLTSSPLETQNLRDVGIVPRR